MPKPLFCGVCASSVTPFHKDGSLHLERLKAYHAKGDGAHWFSTMKAGLNMIGPPVGDPDPPIKPLPAELRGPLAKMLRELGYTVNEDAA